MPKIQLISPDESFEIGDAECAFTIRRVHQDMIREIRRRHTRRIEAEAPGQFPREETDEAEVDRDLMDYLIQDWRGVELADGSPAPCTRENKAALPGSIRTEILMAAGAINLKGDSAGPLRPLKATSGGMEARPA